MSSRSGASGAPPLAPGMTFDGKFRLVRPLGEGGMGLVWMAENVRVRKRVALKLLLESWTANAAVLDRFREEATSAGRIDNPHICDILDFGQTERGPYIVMEMLQGRTLAELLAEHPRLEPGLAAMIARQALAGLGAAHRAGIIHRDIKPENLFLHEPAPGRLLVKLMDFGISKFEQSRKTSAEAVMGTPEYMSPEQAHGAAGVDARTDIWAMGVILYRCLTGREPFAGPTVPAILINLVTKDPTPLRELAPEVPEALATVVHRCLSKDPGGRFPDAESLRAALAPWEGRESELPSAPAPPPTVVHAPPIGESATPPAAPNPTPASASWTMGSTPEARPESTLRGDSRALFGIAVVILAVGVGMFAWVMGTDHESVAAVDADPATSEPVPVTATGSTSVAEIPASTSSTSSSSSGSAPPPDASSSSSSTSTGSTSGEPPDETGSTSGEEPPPPRNPKPRPRPPVDPDPKSPPRPRPVEPDRSLVVEAGGLLAPNEASTSSLRFPEAGRYCSKLRAQNFARVGGWRLPTSAELRRFHGIAQKLQFWTEKGSAVSLGPKIVETQPHQTAGKARALCVAPRP